MKTVLQAAFMAILLVFALTACTNRAIDDGSQVDPAVAPGPAPETPIAPQDDPDSSVEPQNPASEPDDSFPETMLLSADSVWELIETKPAEYQIVDMRRYAEWTEGHIRPSLSLPGGKQCELRIREVDKARAVILVPDADYRGIGKAIQLLEEYGIAADRIFVLDGGMASWVQAGYELEVVLDIEC